MSTSKWLTERDEVFLPTGNTGFVTFHLQFLFLTENLYGFIYHEKVFVLTMLEIPYWDHSLTDLYSTEFAV